MTHRNSCRAGVAFCCYRYVFCLTWLSGLSSISPLGTGRAADSPHLILTWEYTSSNEIGFRINRKTGVYGTYAQIATVGANVTSYTDFNVIAGRLYFYRVRACNQNGNSQFSNEVGGVAGGAHAAMLHNAQRMELGPLAI